MLERTENMMIPQCKNSSLQSISREVDYSWLAGIVDGEGSFDVSLKMAKNNKPYLQVKIRIYNTDIRMIRKVSEIYKSMNVVFFYNLNKKRKSHYKDQLGICVTSQGSCAKILKATAPYLSNKLGMARIMLDIILFVKGCPKGGNSWSFDYVNSEVFQKMFVRWSEEKRSHIDPSTTKRKAGEVLSW